MSKHTPGPWIATDEVERFYEGNIVRAGDAKGSIVAIACDFNRFDRDAERVANSQLIAAAPDLLDALREALDIFADEFCYEDGRVIAAVRTVGSDWVIAARAAIAKATGEGAP